MDLVSVEDGDHPALLIALVVGKDVDQRASRRVKVLPRLRPQLVPGEDDVVSVDQQHLRRLLKRLQQLPLIHLPDGVLREEIPPLHLPVGAGKNPFQFLIFLPGAGVDHPPGGRRVLRGRFRLLVPFQRVGRQVHMPLHLPPADRHPGPVGAEDRIGGIFEVGFGAVAEGSDHLFGAMAFLIPPVPQTQPPLPPGIGGDIGGVPLHRRDRAAPLKGSGLPVHLRRLEGARHQRDVVHYPPGVLGRHRQREVINRLQ